MADRLTVQGVRLRRRRDGCYYDARTPLGQVALAQGPLAGDRWTVFWWPPRWNGRAITLTKHEQSAADAACEADRILERVVSAVESSRG